MDIWTVSAIDTVLSHAGDAFDGRYSVGEKPGKGRYYCTNCTRSVVLDDASDRLPHTGVPRVLTVIDMAANRAPAAAT